MALMRCPDCGKQVSSRAIVCPDCGCPATYFESTDDNLENKAEETLTIDEYDKVEQCDESEKYNQQNETEMLDEFSLLGKSIRYPKNAEMYIMAIKLHNKFAIRGEAEIKKKYVSVNDMDKVWDEVIPLAQCMIDKVVKENVGLLYQANIYMTETDFKNKYNIDLNIYLKEIINAYDEIIHAANEIQRARQFERSGRSQWQGGGFGLKGAVKGAVTAGALNAVTGVGRAIGDSVVDSSDSADLKKAKQTIYSNEKYQNKILRGFHRCISKADLGVAEIMADKGATERIYIDFEKAGEMFAAAYQYEKNKHRLALKAVEALQMYPLEAIFYKPLISEVITSAEDDIDELLRFMKFWNMDEEFSDFAVNVERRTLVNEYFKTHPNAENVDFSDYSPTTYVKLKKVRAELYQAVGSSELPIIVPFCCSLNEYFEECLDKEFCLNSIEVLNKLREECSIDEFVYKIHEEKLVLPGLLKNIWIRGDKENIPELKIKNKWGLPLEDSIYMYQNDAIFGTMFGGKGFVLTNSLLCDLNSKTIIQLKHILDIKYDDKDYKINVLDSSNIISIDVRAEKPAARRFFYACLSAYIERYIKKADSSQCKSSLIFCSYCGKQIMRSVKFCNFCGKENKYSK